MLIFSFSLSFFLLLLEKSKGFQTNVVGDAAGQPHAAGDRGGHGAAQAASKQQRQEERVHLERVLVRALRAAEAKRKERKKEEEEKKNESKKNKK